MRSRRLGSIPLLSCITVFIAFAPIWLVPVTASADTPDDDLRPPFSFSRGFGCVAGGAAGGIALGAAVGYAGAWIFHDESDQDNVAGATTGIVSGLLGYTIGCSFGTYFAGNVGEMTGSYRSTLWGTLIGFVAGGLAAGASEFVLADRNDGSNDTVNAILFLSGPPIIATIGFARSREYDPPRETARPDGWGTGRSVVSKLPESMQDTPRIPRAVRVPIVRIQF